MNFLAHLYLVRDDEQLMLGGLFGDFVRGLRALRAYPPGVREGIRLHRFIDRETDADPAVKQLVQTFPKPYRRYAGIIADIAFDHVLARQWPAWCDEPLDDFDRRVRRILATNDGPAPEKALRFMRYADLRGLFAAYADEPEFLRTLTGVGRRLKRANPLGQVGAIWPDMKGACEQVFAEVMPRIQYAVDDWRNRKSTITGS
ncbi:DUF479 domain-containing protein [Marinihelvus fidelis]|uniref:DUF479 domain-containing protein n=1 Tax=Marinihelvus fidelis TaxID=2613842 RepID=A0A5N0T8V1_9GAMM|nr:ACP phosphodiesterase [Marinihelvus fidelis]KAA9131362.1 DUF479 domain-containing protein [Marinihelvus fidelis]